MCCGPPRAGGGRHARQDHDDGDAGLDPRGRRPASRASWSAACPRTSACRRGSAAAPRGSPFVIEADEYDTAFFDKRSKFVHYRPRTAILNNLEFDHADIFDEPGGDRAPVPPPRAHRAVAAAGWSSTPARRACSASSTMGCWSDGAALRRAQGGARRAARARRAACLRRAARQPEDRRASSGRCWASTTSSTRWPRSARPSTSASRPTWRPRRSASFANVRRRLELRGEAGGRRGLRRLRPPPDRDPHHRQRPAPQGRHAAHPGRLRAALEHHEARRREGAAALGAGGSRPGVLPCRRARLGRRARRSAPLGAQARGLRRPSTSWSPRVVAAARPGDHVLCMSNGGFGGIHAKLLEALAAPRPASPREAMTAPITHLLYLHGFRSSPQSTKARKVAAWIARAPARGGLELPAAAAFAARGDGRLVATHRALAGGSAWR